MWGQRHGKLGPFQPQVLQTHLDLLLELGPQFGPGLGEPFGGLDHALPRLGHFDDEPFSGRSSPIDLFKLRLELRPPRL